METNADPGIFTAAMFRPMLGNPGQAWVLNSRRGRILDFGGIPDSLGWIVDSTSQKFLDSGIRITLHGRHVGGVEYSFEN